MGYAQTILNALGYARHAFPPACDEPGRAVGARSRRRRWRRPASFNLSPEKRTTLDFALDHLAKQRTSRRAIPLPAGAPFGALAVNKQTCTLCKACIGACPESALLDSPETPRAALHRAQLRAVRPVREHLPRGRDRAGAAAAHRRPGEGSGDAERGRAVQLRALRQAVRHAADGRQHARQARRATRCSPGGTRAAADVRRLPRGRHDGEQGRSAASSTSRNERRAAAEFVAPEEQARANFYGLLARLFYAPPDDAAARGAGGGRRIEAETTSSARRWRELVALRGRHRSPKRCATSTTSVFVGTGKAPVTLYAVAYSVRLHERNPLVELRGELAAWGSRGASEVGRAGRPHRGAVRHDAPPHCRAASALAEQQALLRALDRPDRRAVVRCNRGRPSARLLSIGRARFGESVLRHWSRAAFRNALES